MKDLLIDTNALILYVLGSVNRQYFVDNRKHNRISAYSKKEFDLLCSVVAAHERMVSSPNVWTEVDNLCTNYIHGSDKYNYIQLMKKLIAGSFEKYIESKFAVEEDECFYHIGITDSVLLKLAKDCENLVTGDSRLADFARSQGISVIDLKEIATRNIRG